MRLTGKSALVTGGAQRIGRAIALALAQAGADLTITYRDSEVAAEATVCELIKSGSRAQAIRCDLRSEASIQATIAQAVSFHHHLDIVVNCAAVFDAAPLDQLTLNQWDAVFETNTRAPFLVSREAMPWLRLTEGRIVNIGSLGGLHAWGTHAHYCASKAALHSLTQSMAKAFAPAISVNGVAPGWIEFEKTPEAEHFAAKTPMQRNGTAEDVAAAVIFFATGPKFITGQILVVDGGLGLC